MSKTGNLQGEEVQELFNSDSLYVKVELNKDDEEARTQNEGKKDPILLQAVPKFGNAVIVDSGSVIKFVIRAKGPYGYGFSITTPDPNQPIVKKLYCIDRAGSGELLEESVRTYQDTRKNIQINDWNTAQLSSKAEIENRWSCRVTTWNVYGFIDDMGEDYGEPLIGKKLEEKSVEPNQQVKFLKAPQFNELAVASSFKANLSEAGSSKADVSVTNYSGQVSGGSLTGWGKSGEYFNEVSHVNDFNEIEHKLQSLNLYFFVF